MNKVYVLMGYDTIDRDSFIQGIYSNQEKAEDAANFLEQIRADYEKENEVYTYEYYIKEYALDELHICEFVYEDTDSSEQETKTEG